MASLYLTRTTSPNSLLIKSNFLPIKVLEASTKPVGMLSPDSRREPWGLNLKKVWVFFFPFDLKQKQVKPLPFIPT